jgi:hypothetical protein
VANSDAEGPGTGTLALAVEQGDYGCAYRRVASGNNSILPQNVPAVGRMLYRSGRSRDLSVVTD